MPNKPPGYWCTQSYSGDSQFKRGLYLLQRRGQVKETQPNSPLSTWVNSTSLARELRNFNSKLFTVVSTGKGSILLVYQVP
jgi:hypothetical protein